MNQSTFDFDPDPDREPVGSYEKFLDYHRANPEVLVWLTKQSYVMARAGHRNIGINMLFEVLRWSVLGDTTHVVGFKMSDGFKVNNNHAPFYARLIMYRHPDLDGVFRTKEAEAKTDDNDRH